MSQSPPNYMENVPVKISERYKPPPKISLPQSVCQRLNADDIPCLSLAYDFSLERNVLRRIDEWTKVREAERDARRERIRKRENERLRIEEEQKKLLTAVSYPSADDLSSDDEQSPADDDAGGAPIKSAIVQAADVDTIKSTMTASPAVQVRYNCPSQQQRQPAPRFDTILTPTIAPESELSAPIHKQIYSKINYSDFENDTTPFDNIELKTINDLDILAQVLNVTQLHSNSSPIASNQNDDDSLSPPTSSSQNEEPSPPSSNNANQQQNATHPYNSISESTENCNPIAFSNSVAQNTYITSPSHQALQNANHFYTPYHNSSGMQNTLNMNGAPRTQDFYYYPQAHTQPINYDNYMYSSVNNYPPNSIQSNPNSNTVMEATRATATNVAHSKNTVTFRDITETTMTEEEGAVAVSTSTTSSSSSSAAKNKSKSVPDILRELNEDLRVSESRRIRNNSQTVETCENKINETAVVVNKPKPVDETFMKLSPSSQMLAKNISSMGFPLELVSRISERVGNDDKKIVEHLIPLSELLDLGFDETRISEALLRFDNNKEKALDFLIS